MNVASFVFNAFQENSYILFDDTKEAIIIDPGCNSPEEQQELSNFIKANGLKPVQLINTHCHIDHVLGNKYVSEKYGLGLQAHKGEDMMLNNQPNVAMMYGIPYDPSPAISTYLSEEDTIQFGNTTLEIYFTPGHSPASISFFHKESRQLIAGDVLFQGSIGRTDLPGGSFETLIDSIKTQFYPLGDDVVVYSGHGPSTTIGEEKMSNPFLK